MSAVRPVLERFPQLAAFCLAALVSGLAGALAWQHECALEACSIHGVCPRGSLVPTQSAALQRAALAQPDLLVMYGSSEMSMPVAERPTSFFRTYPTGFEVFPIGQGGSYPLITVQKLAADGADLRGKKVAISLSSGWFRHAEMKLDAFAGNFSPLDRCALLFSRDLSMRLRRDVARRLEAVGSSPTRWPVADFAQRQLADSSRSARLRYWAAWPLGQLQTAILRLQDHYEAWLFLDSKNTAPLRVHRQPASLDWNALLAEAAARAGDTPDDTSDPAAFSTEQGSRDPIFAAHVRTSQLWNDLRLLLHTLRELGAEPLILSTPFNGPHQAAMHVSRPARQLYYDRLTRCIRGSGFPGRDFEEHDEDKRFALDEYDHLSGKGWMFYNQELDDFFHARPGLSRSARTEMRSRRDAMADRD